jgi:hypothetical protein
MTEHPLLDKIHPAVELGRAGDHETARAQLTALWAEADGDRWARCAIAHYLADVQDETEDELSWDLRALESADPADAATAGMLPSLHLNLADDYRRLGETAKAEEHLAVVRAHLGVLGDDAYGDLVRRAVEHVTAALAAGNTERLPSNPSS